jgi:hypothetical protein
MNHLIINRNFYENGVFKGSDDKDNYAPHAVPVKHRPFGADFFPSKNTILGFVINGNYNNFTRLADIRTSVNDRFYSPYLSSIPIGTNDDEFGNTVANITSNTSLTAPAGSSLPT